MMRLAGGVVLLLVMLLGTLVHAEPIALHPENGHYFLWRGRPAILVTSGEHYGAVLNLDFNFDRYLKALAADGLNHTRLFSGIYREDPGAFGITDNTLSPKADQFVCPWPRSEVPGALDGGNKFDLSRWNEAYFERLRRFMIAAEKAGVVVEFTLFCPMYDEPAWAASPLNPRSHVNGFGDCSREELLSLKHPQIVRFHEEFVKKVVGELNEFDNLYFEVCNEPYHGKITNEWQGRMTDVIAAAEKELPKRHLISWNVANGRKKVEKPDPRVSIFNFHYCVPPDTVTLNYGLNKVIGENETGFRGSEDYLYRSEAWNFLLAGGALFNNLDYSFTARHSGGDLRGYTSPGGGSPELRKQLGILKRFIEGFDFVRMKPDATVVHELPTGLAVQVLAEPARAYAIYLHTPLPDKPQRLEDHLRKAGEATVSVDIPRGRYRAEWIDTLTGDTMSSETFVASKSHTQLQSPSFSNDIALRIVAVDKK